MGAAELNRCKAPDQHGADDEDIGQVEKQAKWMLPSGSRKVTTATDLDAVYEVAAAPAHHKGTQPAVRVRPAGQGKPQNYTDHEHRHADKKPACQPPHRPATKTLRPG